MSDQSKALSPIVELRPVEDAEGAVLKIERACEREFLRSPADLAKVIAAAGGLVFFIAGREILVSPGAFSSAVKFARHIGAL